MDKDLIFRSFINDREDGKTILSFLTERFTYFAREEWFENISAGRIRLNGEIVMADHVVSPGDDLSFHPEHLDEPEYTAEPEIIASLPGFLLTGKPTGIPVSRTGLIVVNTFINILRRKFNNPDIHLMHRLDRDTSGLLLCATSRDSCRRHQKNFAQIMTGKYYLAIVRGRLETAGLKIDLPLATAPSGEIRCRVMVDQSGKPSTSIFHTVAATAEKSLILARLVTGRRHQLRCHLSHLGHPVIGDKIYSHEGKFYLKRLEQALTDQDYLELDARNHTLHAWAADITLPGHGEMLYQSHCFSPDFIRHAAAFPDWPAQANALLAQIRHPQKTQTG